MRRLIRIFLFSFLPFYVYSQSNTLYSHLNKDFIDLSKDVRFAYLDTNNNFRIGPKFFALSSVESTNITNTYLLGLSFDANINDKLIMSGLYEYLNGDYNLEIKNYQDSLGIYYPGFGLENNRLQFNAQYLPNSFITLDVGYGKQFIGNGYQSLLLSDIASSYPYLKLSTKFGPVEYYNIYTTFVNPGMTDFGRKKHATIHYLDIAIKENIHLGVFESILWQSKSEEVNKGYELAYLNPVIFYRPVEFSQHSSKGNALMGANLNLLFKSVTVYGQFLLDDLNISRQKDGDENYQEGFFQNKYGYQLGLKGVIGGVKYLLEYNQVQPYTYGHRTILQNYSHMNQPLAHPLGANFKELINLLEIRKGNWTYKLKTIFTNVGLDSLNTHYGQNIFASDYDASTGGQYSYGNFNGQGVNTMILSFQPEVSFNFKSISLFGMIFYRAKTSNLLDQTLIFYSVGIRTFPFKAFQDY